MLKLPDEAAPFMSLLDGQVLEVQCVCVVGSLVYCQLSERKISESC